MESLTRGGDTRSAACQPVLRQQVDPPPWKIPLNVQDIAHAEPQKASCVRRWQLQRYRLLFRGGRSSMAEDAEGTRLLIWAQAGSLSCISLPCDVQSVEALRDMRNQAQAHRDVPSVPKQAASSSDDTGLSNRSH